MRILFVGGGSRFWGMEQMLLSLESGLCTRGVKCANLISGWHDGVFAEKLAQKEIEVFPLKLGRIYWRKPLWTFETLINVPRATVELWRIMAAYRPDVVVHLDNRLFVLVYPLIAAFKRCRHVYLESVVPSPSRLESLSYRMILNRCSPVMINCPETEEVLARSGLGSAKLVSITNGTDFVHGGHPAPGRDEPIRIGIVGQVIARKGHDTLIEAARRLRLKGLTFRLVVIGDGQPEFTSHIRQLAADATLEEMVTWTGALHDRDEIFGQIDVLVVPSRSEAFGLVAIEAGAAGLPVVASRVGGLQRIVADGETGLLVPPDDPVALAEALAELITKPDVGRIMGQAGRHRVATHYGVPRMVDEFIGAIGPVDSLPVPN